MSYTVLARRYRSATFDEVVGQSHVAQTLKKAIESGRIAHAYLFCGTRGTGKTSMARILAKALNCEKNAGPSGEPCGQCASCQAVARGEDMDVIEIDAASNTGVDNIRDVIENSQYRPARSRFKVYIIDEVHMLSKPAFNALLKTLEEPPGHVKFILATTEPEKVLPTILSRCQRYDFRNIPTRDIAAHLRDICKKENIEADETALLLVARAGAGSMRDALSLLDRLLSIGQKQLTAQMIEELLGLPRSQLIYNLAQSIGQGDVKAVLTSADSMIAAGLSVDTLVGSLVEHLRNLLILRTCGRDSGLVEVPGLAISDLEKQAQQFDAVALTQDLAILEELRRQMRQTQAGRALLDATLVRLTLAEQFASVGDLLSRLEGGGTPTGRGMPATPVQKKKSEPVTAVVESAPAGVDEASVATDASPVMDAVEQTAGETAMSAPAVSSEPAAAVVAPAPAGADAVAVDVSDLKAVWQGVLQRGAEKGQAFSSLLAYGRLGGFEENQAIVRYPHAQEMLARILDKNGKREQLRDVISEVIGRPVGVRIEVDAAAEAAPAATNGAEVAGAARAPARAENVAAPAVVAAAPEPANRLTPDLRTTLEADPFIKLIQQELGGAIVRVE